VIQTPTNALAKIGQAAGAILVLALLFVAFFWLGFVCGKGSAPSAEASRSRSV